MDRSRLIIPVALVLAVMIGVAGYFGATAMLAKDAAGGGRAAAQRSASLAAQARLKARVAALEKRLEQIEAKPSLEESFDDPEVRKQLAEVMVEARRREREAAERKRREERVGSVVRWYRSSYDRLVADARVKSGMDEKSWAQLAPVFKRHFEPVAKAARDRVLAGEGRWGWVRVNINGAVAPILPETLAALQKGMPGKSWSAFDAWRRKPASSRYRQNISGNAGEYFLGRDDLKKVTATAAVERRWGVLKRELPELTEGLRLDAAKAKDLEKILHAHARNFTAAFDGQRFVNVNDEGNLAKVRKLAVGTDAAVRKLLDDAGYAKYEKWKKDPGSRVRYYFGARVTRRGRRDRRADAPAPRRPAQPAQPEPQPAKPKKKEVF
jgi:hypothetical protein